MQQIPPHQHAAPLVASAERAPQGPTQLPRHPAPPTPRENCPAGCARFRRGVRRLRRRSPPVHQPRGTRPARRVRPGARMRGLSAVTEPPYAQTRACAAMPEPPPLDHDRHLMLPHDLSLSPCPTGYRILLAPLGTPTSTRSTAHASKLRTRPDALRLRRRVSTSGDATDTAASTCRTARCFSRTCTTGAEVSCSAPTPPPTAHATPCYNLAHTHVLHVPRAYTLVLTTA